MLDERWAVLSEYREARISDLGRVEHISKRRPIPVRENKQGFEMVTIMNTEGKQKTRSVAGLVASAFLPPPRNEFYNSLIHLNGDRSDCRALNLMWRPRWFAIRYHQMFNENPYRVSVYIPAVEQVYFSLREACVKYGLVEHQTYMDMLNGNPCFHYNWILQEYVE